MTVSMVVVVTLDCTAPSTDGFVKLVMTATFCCIVPKSGAAIPSSLHVGAASLRAAFRIPKVTMYLFHFSADVKDIKYVINYDMSNNIEVSFIKNPLNN